MKFNIKIYKFLLGLYLAVTFSITGYYLINPTILYDIRKVPRLNSYGEIVETKMLYDREIDINKLDTKQTFIVNKTISYKKFKYSILISIVLLLLIYSMTQLLSIKKPNG